MQHTIIKLSEIWYETVKAVVKKYATPRKPRWKICEGKGDGHEIAGIIYRLMTKNLIIQENSGWISKSSIN